MHRQRQGWVAQRTETANRIRAVLLEFGITIPKGLRQLRRELPFVLEDHDNGLPDRTRQLLHALWRDLLDLHERVDWIAEELQRTAEQDPRGRALLGVPGIGPVIATALIAAVGDARAFRPGRDLAAWLGIVLKQYSTGGKTRLLGISKQGNSYLRSILIHRARCLVRHAVRRNDAFARWIQRLQVRKVTNIVAVAVANKLARAACVVLHRREPFDGQALVG